MYLYILFFANIGHYYYYYYHHHHHHPLFNDIVF